MAAEPFCLLPKLTLGVPHILRDIITGACDSVNEIARLCLVSRLWKYFIEEEILLRGLYPQKIEKEKFIHAWREGKLSPTLLRSPEDAGLSDPDQYETVDCLSNSDTFVHVLRTDNDAMTCVVYSKGQYLGKFILDNKVLSIFQALQGNDEQKLWIAITRLYGDPEIRCYELNSNTKEYKELLEERKRIHWNAITFHYSNENEIKLITVHNNILTVIDLENIKPEYQHKIPFQCQGSITLEIDAKDDMILICADHSNDTLATALINMADGSIVANEVFSHFNTSTSIQCKFEDNLALIYSTGRAPNEHSVYLVIDKVSDNI